MVNTTGSTYAAVALFLWFGWPFLALAGPGTQQQEEITFIVVAEVFLIGGFVLAHVRCSSPIVSYWNGLCVVGGAWRTGIIQLSMIIACPIILLAHLIGTFIAILSVAFGKPWGQRGFVRTCHIFSRGKFNLQQVLGALSAQSQST